MTIFDRYLLRLFFKTLMVCFVSMAGLYIVVDVFSNLDELIAHGKENGGVLKSIGDYYGVRMLAFFDMTCGLLLLISAMFTMTWVQRTHEFTALLAAGLPKARIVAPLLVASIVVVLISAGCREFVIPQLKDRLATQWRHLAGAVHEPLRPRYDNQTRVFFDGRSIVKTEELVEAPLIRLPVPVPGAGKQLSARTARYLAAVEGRPSGYLLDQVQPAGVAEAPSLWFGQLLILMTPLDTPWLAPDQAFLVSDLDFEQLSADRAWRQWTSIRGLVVALRNPSIDFGADVRVAVHSRLLKPILDMTLLFLALPLVLRTRSKSMFAAAGMALLVMTGYYVVAMGCQAMGANYLLSPALAAWSPILIFAPLAYANSTALWS